MKRAGYEVKTARGGGISFRLTGQGQERFTRLRASTLGTATTCKIFWPPLRAKKNAPDTRSGKSVWRWIFKRSWLPVRGRDMNAGRRYLTLSRWPPLLPIYKDNGLTDYEQLAQKATEATDCFHAISEQVKQTEQAMKTKASAAQSIDGRSTSGASDSRLHKNVTPNCSPWQQSKPACPHCQRQRKSK